MEVTKEQLKQIYPLAKDANIEVFLPFLNKYFAEYEVDTYERICAFLAQVGHECSQLKTIRENLNYPVSGLLKTFGKYFTSATASEYAHNPPKIANRVYANRLGNGSEASGDGWKYRGRGLIQCTGKNNYTAFGKFTGLDCVKSPDLLLEPKYAVLSAFWYWHTNNLNKYATSNTADFKMLTRRINGGLNGYADRYNIWTVAKNVLG